MNTYRRSFLIGFFILCFMILRPEAKLFAACSYLPSITSPTNITGTCTIDSPATISDYSANGIDIISGANNVGLITLNTGSSMITINAGAHLLVGSISIPADAAGAYISIQAAVTSPITLPAGQIDINQPAYQPYVVDSDSDGYAASLTLVTSGTAGARRLGLMQSATVTDCNDSSALTYANKTCYADADGDGYSVSSGTSVCSGSTCPSGYVDSPTAITDCNDNYNTVWNSAAGSCYQDGDDDGYGKSSSSTYTCFNTASCATATAGSVGTGVPVTSSNFSANKTDCNDGSSSVWTTVSCYRDYDLDGETRGLSAVTCANNASCPSITAGSITGDSASVTVYTAGQLKTSETANVDCCDTNANVNHSITPYPVATFTCADGIAPTPLAYDYNCSGTNDLDTTGVFASSTLYSCTNPCASCALNYSYTAGWTTAMPSSCGSTATQTIGNGSYTAGTCYTVANCAAMVITTTPIARGCR